MLEISEREEAGWVGTAVDLLLNDVDAIIQRLENFVTQQLRLVVEQPQRKAWPSVTSLLQLPCEW